MNYQNRLHDDQFEFYDISIIKINEIMIHDFDLDYSIKLMDVSNNHNYNIVNDIL